MSMFDKNEPYAVELKAGDSLWICTCGQTKTPPACDGTHNDLPNAAGPVEHKAGSDETVYVCGCGKTQTPPYCDGSHNA